jgi:plasmid stabilization system protein ParE
MWAKFSITTERFHPSWPDDSMTSSSNCMEKIAATPKRFSPIDLSSGLRRARLPDFPYLIIYRELDDRVRVLSVRHEERDTAHASERR